MIPLIDETSLPSSRSEDLRQEVLAEMALIELASPPTAQAFRPWMIDFSGWEGHRIPEAVQAQVLTTGAAPDMSSIEDASYARHHETPRALRAFLAAHGFEVADSGAGPDGWDLGVSCTFAAAQRLAELVRSSEFDAFRALGVRARLCFWGFDASGPPKEPPLVFACSHVLDEQGKIDEARVRTVFRYHGQVRVRCAEDEPAHARDGYRALTLTALATEAPALRELLQELGPHDGLERADPEAPWLPLAKDEGEEEGEDEGEARPLNPRALLAQLQERFSGRELAGLCVCAAMALVGRDPGALLMLGPVVEALARRGDPLSDPLAWILEKVLALPLADRTDFLDIFTEQVPLSEELLAQLRTATPADAPLLARAVLAHLPRAHRNDA
jgi:hypothetical protein